MIGTILLQTSIVIVAVWLISRFATKLTFDTKAWLWRIALVKPLVCLLPFMMVPLAVLKSSESRAEVAPLTTTTTLPVPSAATAPTAAPFEIPWLALWVAGASTFAILGLVSLVRTRKLAAACGPVKSRDVHLAAYQLCRAAGLDHTISISESDQANTPMLITLGKANLVLPSALVREGTPEDIRAILAHEIAHFVRRDPIWTTIGWISRTVFFFNPFIWIAVHCSRVANESATDYLACQLAKISPSDYAGMLLRSTVVVRKLEPVGALHLSGPLKTMHRRLEAMKHFNTKPNIWHKLVGFTTVAAVIGLLPLYQLAEAQDKPAKPSKPAKAAKSAKVATTKKNIQKSTPAKAPIAPSVAIATTAPANAPAAPVIANRAGAAPAVAAQPGQPVPPGQATSRSGSTSSQSSYSGSSPAAPGVPVLPSIGGQIASSPAYPSMGGQSANAGQSVSSNSSSSSSASSSSSSSSGGSNGARSSNSSQSSDSSQSSNRSQNSSGQQNSNSSRDSQNSSSSDSSKSSSSDSQRSGNGILIPPGFAGQSRPSSGSVSGQQTQDGMLISYKFENFTFEKAIKALFDQAGKKVRFEGMPLSSVSGQAKNVTFEVALKTLLTAGRLEMKMDNGIALIRPINFGDRINP